MPLSRRQFLTTAAAGTAAIVAAPAVITASKVDKPLIVGEGEHRFEVQHEWPQLPENTLGRQRTTSPSTSRATSTSSMKDALI